MKLSQSSLKDYLVESLDGCMYRWKLRHIDHLSPTDDGKWNALKKGILFERLVIGASRFDEPLNIPTLKNGDPTAEERTIREMATNAKDLIRDMGIKLIEVQVDLSTQTRTGHPDAVIHYDGMTAIMDLKYTETDPDDKWRGWGEPQEMNHTQALDYVNLYHEIHGKWVPFYYLVFGKSGWCKFIKVNITPEAMKAHTDQVQWVLEEIKTQNYNPTTDFNTCAGCQFNDQCKKRRKLPNVEIIKL